LISFYSYSQDTTIVYEFAGFGFNDVSSNGEWVCGTNGDESYLWSEATGLIYLGEGFAKGVSNTGRVVGQGVDSTLILPNGTPVPVACYWEPDGSYHSLGQFLNVPPFDPTLYSHGNSISDDGKIIAGMGCYPDYTTEAFTWTEDSGYVLYGQLGYGGTRANVISGDGNIIAGWGLDSVNQRLPIIWNPDPYMIPPFGPYQGGEIEGLNYNGSIAYGETFGTQAYVPFYWSEATGAVNLTDINIFYPAYAFDGNADASRIVGRFGPSPGQAYIWENGNGQYLKDWVLAHGGQISNDFIAVNANGISSDGNTICGWGVLPGTYASGVIIKIKSGIPVEVEFSSVLEYQLAQNYPNPFNPSTKISFSIAERSNVRLSVFNILGEQVATLVNEVKDAGSYKVEFNASNLPSGIYIYTLEAGRMKSSKKMMLIK